VSRRTRLLAIAPIVLLEIGCACGHARHADAIREGADHVVDMTSVALVRSLTPAEAATLDRAREQLREHARLLAEDARGD